MNGIDILNNQSIEIVGGTNVSIEVNAQDQITINSELSVVKTPVPVSPLSGVVDVSVTPALAAGVYGNLYGVARQYREFQVDVIGGDFSSPIRTIQVDADSWVVDPELLDATEFKWRCRDVDLDGEVSGWSEEQSFTTIDIYIATPSITKPTQGGGLLERNDTVESSVYEVVNGNETHVASYWEFYDINNTLVHSSDRTTTSLRVYNVPSGVVVEDQVMEVRVRYEGSEGRMSDWSVPVSFTGIGTGYGNYMSVAHSLTPFVTSYGIDVESMFRLSNPTGGLLTNQGNGVAFSPDGTYMSVAHNSAPRITIYKRNGDTFTKLANPDVQPTGNSNGVAFSPDGTYMSVAHTTSPFVTIYKREGDAFTKLANPDVLPTSTGHGVAFSSSGEYMAVCHASAPLITIYKIEIGDIFTNLPQAIDVLPSSQCNGAAFNSDGTHLSVAMSATPFIASYAIVDGTFTLLPNPSVLPTGAGNGIAYSGDGTKLAVAHTTTPFVTVYKKEGNDLTKLANPTGGLPASDGRGVAFWPSALYPSQPT